MIFTFYKKHNAFLRFPCQQKKWEFMRKYFTTPFINASYMNKELRETLEKRNILGKFT